MTSENWISEIIAFFYICHYYAYLLNWLKNETQASWWYLAVPGLQGLQLVCSQRWASNEKRPTVPDNTFLLKLIAVKAWDFFCVYKAFYCTPLLRNLMKCIIGWDCVYCFIFKFKIPSNFYSCQQSVADILLVYPEPAPSLFTFY